jgi:hypothetical protein
MCQAEENRQTAVIDRVIDAKCATHRHDAVRPRAR